MDATVPEVVFKTLFVRLFLFLRAAPKDRLEQKTDNRLVGNIKRMFSVSELSHPSLTCHSPDFSPPATLQRSFAFEPTNDSETTNTL